MPRSASTLLLLYFALFVSYPSFARGGSSLRRLLNKFHINVSAGYGRTSHSCSIGGAGNVVLFKKDGNIYIADASNPDRVYWFRWFDDPYLCIKSYYNFELFDPDDLTVANVVFKGVGNTIPIILSGHANICKRLRLGFAGGILINYIKSFKPDKGYESLGTHTPARKQYYTIRPLAIQLGYEFIQTPFWTFIVGTSLGFDAVYKTLNLRQQPTELFSTGMQSIGLKVERNISEYFRVFSELTYERKNATKLLGSEAIMTLLERGSIIVQLGIGINCPEVPKCPVPHCSVKQKHRHGNRVYRGVSMFRGRDSLGRRLHRK